jgi:hypothetical protein
LDEEVMSNDQDMDPCGEPPFRSFCDGQTEGNYWCEDGKCLLDDMYPWRKDQVIYILEHTPQARHDLPLVTSCPELLHLLEEVPLLPTTQEDDEMQNAMNKNDSLPFYTLYRGRCGDR